MGQALLSTQDLSDALGSARASGQSTLAVVPVGCTEQHGPFLPLVTDTLVAEAFCFGVAERLSQKGIWAYVLPPLSYSPTRSNRNFEGTVSISEDAFRRVAEEAAESLLESSFDAVAFLCGHGPAESSLREICFKLVGNQFSGPGIRKPVMVATLFGHETELEEVFGQKPGRHGDWREFLFVYRILGSDYFTEEKLQRYRTFAQGTSFAQKQPMVPGVPLELRSGKGIVGDPLPTGEGSLGMLSDKIWDFYLCRVSEDVASALDDFRCRFGGPGAKRE